MDKEPKIAEGVSGFVIDGQQYTFVGIPPEAFVSAPSPFGDQKDVKMYFVEKTEHPKEGGFLSYRRNMKYPYKGIVSPEILEMVNVPKRLLRSGTEIAIKRWYFWAWYLLIPVWRKRFLWDMAEWFAQYSFHFLRRFYIRPEWNCTCVREYYRVAQKIFWETKFNEKERWIVDKLVLAGGMFLESDDSYRYRVQDIFGALNKEQFMKSPSKELARLLMVLKERGTDAHKPAGVAIPDEVEKRVRPLATLLMLMFFLFPSWKRKAKEFVKEINLEKMKLDEGDFYHCMVRPDYKFGGIPFEIRIEQRKKIDAELWDKQVDKTFMDEK